MTSKSTTPDSRVRSQSIDVLRGIAILGMMFSGVLPWDGLPAWMYHGQEPPPSHAFNPNLAALTWVDLVFPFFIFSMGVAIPLALQSNADRGPSQVQSILNAVKRFGLLVAFAILNQHFRPYRLSDSPTTSTWFLGLLGFFIVALIYVRVPRQWPIWITFAARLVGWGGAIFVLSQLRYSEPNHPGFSLERSDPIILVLASVSLFGTLGWLVTKKNQLVGVFIMAIVLCLKLGSLQAGSWAQSFWNYEGPIGWFFHPSFLQYLLIFVPGTMVGDWLTHAPEPSEDDPVRVRMLQSVMALASIPLCLTVLFERIPSFYLLAVAGGLALLGTRSCSGLTRSLLGWGSGFLTLGILLEPFEGGIKKDHPTLSYMLVTAGLAMFALVALTHYERSRPQSISFRFLSGTGRNPLLAYEALTNLVAPLWALTIGGWIAEHTPGVPLGLARAGLQTLLLGVVVNLFTRWKIYFGT
jgi:predicted acyltransferase